jgi:homoserine kinase
MVAELVVRVPASSANLGPGFDVLGMALDLCADFGTGVAPDGALQLDEYHPTSIAFVSSGGAGPVWMRGSIPMGRGLGFSGAARVGGAALAVVQGAEDPSAALHDGAENILRTSAGLEGHTDNVAASLYGGVVASVDRAALPLSVGPMIAAATVVVWIPETTTSTDSSRAGLPSTVERPDAVHNLGRVVQFVLAVERDDPTLLVGATSDRLHQSRRLSYVAASAEALAVGVDAGAWCGWLSGSGPTIAFLCETSAVSSVVESLPGSGHCKELKIDTLGARLVH